VLFVGELLGFDGVAVELELLFEGNVVFETVVVVFTLVTVVLFGNVVGFVPFAAEPVEEVVVVVFDGVVF